MVGPRKESHGHSPLGLFKNRSRMPSALSNLTSYHISEIMVRMSQLPPLTWSLRPGPWPRDYVERLRGVPGGPR